jgi:hypothetical protein
MVDLSPQGRHLIDEPWLLEHIYPGKSALPSPQLNIWRSRPLRWTRDRNRISKSLRSTPVCARCYSHITFALAQTHPKPMSIWSPGSDKDVVAPWASSRTKSLEKLWELPSCQATRGYHLVIFLLQAKAMMYDFLLTLLWFWHSATNSFPTVDNAVDCDKTAPGIEMNGTLFFVTRPPIR